MNELQWQFAKNAAANIPLPCRSLVKVDSAWEDYIVSYIEEFAIGYLKQKHRHQACVREVAANLHQVSHFPI